MTIFILHGLKPTLSAVFCEPAFVSACAHTGLLPYCMISSRILYARYDASPWCLCASAVSTPISTSSGLTALENATAAKLPSASFLAMHPNPFLRNVSLSFQEKEGVILPRMSPILSRILPVVFSLSTISNRRVFQLPPVGI